MKMKRVVSVPNRREKPHKRVIAKMKEDFFTAKNESRRKSFSKSQEIELCYLEDEIGRRWFRFFADHYLTEPLKQYCKIIHNAPYK